MSKLGKVKANRYALKRKTRGADAYGAWNAGVQLRADNSPVLTLLKRFRRIRLDRITRPEQLCLFVRAWNAFRKDETPGTFIIAKDGKLTNDNFPMPR